MSNFGFQTITFRPSSSVENIKLDEISKTMGAITVSSSLLFNGHLDTLRFQNSLQVVADVCPWLYGALCVEENGDVNVAPRCEGDGGNSDETTHPGYFTCQIVNDSESNYHPDQIEEILPTDVHELMLRPDLAMQSLHGLPISAFRVTQYSTQFAISYRLNHVFYDQASIVYLLLYLSDVYSHGNVATLAAPIFHPRAKLVPDEAQFKTIEEFDNAAPEGYVVAPPTGIVCTAPIVFNLTFHVESVSSWRHGASSPVSTNDLLHAIFIKAVSELAGNDAVNTTPLRVLYARNMRIPLSFGEHIVGDYVRLGVLHGTKDVATSTDLFGLAQSNREVLLQPLGNKYTSECNWFINITKFYPGQRPNSDFLSDKQAAVVTNWSSFPYERIRFDDSEACELLIAPPKFSTNLALFAFVGFKGCGSDRRLTVLICSIFPELKTIIEKIGLDCGLFSVSA